MYNNNRGLLIVVEGTDGSGKTTQINMLKRWLEDNCYVTKISKVKTSKIISNLIDEAKANNILTPTTFSLLYALDFADRLETVILPALKSGFNGQSFEDIANYLLTNSPIADPYMCMADFSEYVKIHEKADETYKNVMKWQKMSLNNIAGAGVFAADRSIKEYAERIWNLKSIK